MVKLSVYWIQTMVFGSSRCIPTNMRKHKEPRQRESKVQCIASRKLLNSRNSTEVHVLAVDDSIIDRKIIERLLKINAYKVTTVDSGMRALEVLGATDAQSHLSMNAFKINLIITDYCMPGMTGFELLKRVKETAALKEIPVVMMSSENVPNHIDRCLAEGAEDFLIKPVQLTDIQRLKAHIKITQQHKCPQGSRSNSCKKQKLSSAESPQNNSEKENHLRGVALV